VALELGEVAVQRVYEYPERQVTLVLCGTALQHQQSAGGCVQRFEKCRLANARLSDDLDDTGRSCPDVRQSPCQGSLLCGAAH
jgi:hypothetical protein